VKIVTAMYKLISSNAIVKINNKIESKNIKKFKIKMIEFLILFVHLSAITPINIKLADPKIGGNIDDIDDSKSVALHL